MSNRASIKLKNNSAMPMRLIVEPWATEFDLPSGSSCEVFSVGGIGVPAIDLESVGGAMIFWINTDGAIYEYWQDGKLVD